MAVGVVGLQASEHGNFVPARGASTSEMIPLPDLQGEDPWLDLWFYSSPVFVEAAR